MPEKPKNEPKTPENIELQYLKTSNYRTYYVSGVFGGGTPNGNIYMELFVERAPTPKIVVHKLGKNGSLGEEIKREGKTGIIREVEAGLVMDLKTASLLKEWLSEKIEQIEKRFLEQGDK